MSAIKLSLGFLFVALLMSAGCQADGDPIAGSSSEIAQAPSFLKALDRPQTWADCELFDGVVTRGTFNPESDPFDELYAGGNGFLNDVPLISQSKPGDQDYNGGRWHLNVLRAGVDPDKYANACTVEELDLSDFESMESYFECPLLPRRGGR
jgi:hypothetical protein